MNLLRLIVSSGWEFALAAGFLITWMNPYFFGETAVHHLTFLMLVEFMVVHATGFLSALSGPGIGDEKRSNGFILGILILLYCLFGLAFSAMYGSLWPLWALLFLIIPKTPAILWKPISDDAQFAAMGYWAFMTCMYLFGCFATLMYDVPPLGITPEVIERQAFGAEGIWPEEPYRVMAFGAIYFTGLGIGSLVMELWQARKPHGNGTA